MKILFFGIGNPARGDDALGIKYIKRIKNSPGITVLSDYQLKPEHAVGLSKYDKAVFVDADVSLNAPYKFNRIRPAANCDPATHMLSPEALLHICRHTLKEPPPESYLLAIRGYDFGLKEGLSNEARNNLLKAWRIYKDLLTA